jgi:hypothetical protein
MAYRGYKIRDLRTSIKVKHLRDAAILMSIRSDATDCVALYLRPPCPKRIMAMYEFRKHVL